MTKKQVLKQVRERKYLNKDFDSLKSDLLEYARTYFPNQIKDFSESSLGGLFLDFASYVGDVDSFYLDHQFHELDPTSAVEVENIERHLINAGVPIVGSAPAVVRNKFYIEVPCAGNPAMPIPESLPIIVEGTVTRADNGTLFETIEDLNFAETDESGKLLAQREIGKKNNQGEPITLILSREVDCISGFRNTETFTIGSFVPFLELTLGKENVTDIISVVDGKGNTYYEVEFLTQDTTFLAVPNRGADSNLVKNILVPTPAPYRFIKKTSLNTRLTSIVLGGGSAETMDDNIVPDPSEFALPMYGKKSVSRFTLNPGNMLRTSTLGMVSPNTVLHVTYRYGGGLGHNVPEDSIRDVVSLNISFPKSPPVAISQAVRASVDVRNERRASGGDDPPTIDALKARIPEVRASQGRIVSKEDLLARVYTLPANFGRVFRATTHPNPNNPLSANLFVISKDNNNNLIVAPDTLKRNLARYLNEYRLISDALDILDAQVINFKIHYSVVIDPEMSDNNNTIIQNINKKLMNYFNISNFHIDQPLVISDVQNLIYNTPGIYSVDSVKVLNVYGDGGNGPDTLRTYSSTQYNFESNTDRGIIFGPPGSIFELKYPDYDIVGVPI